MKIRADLLLTEQGLFESRSAAQRAIMAGLVRVGPDHVVRNAAETWPEGTVFVVAETSGFVSRGAGKLQPMLEKHLPDLTGLQALDLGASTGGFTDLMLQRGACRVYAVDVGHGQLHWRLREDPRVVCLERTNARYLTSAQIPEPMDLMTADLSFIGLEKVLPAVVPLLRGLAWVFVLIKPQFEARREEVGKGGVVRSAEVRDRVVGKIATFAETQLGWQHLETSPSPVLGPKGNQESIGVFRTAAT